MEFDKLLIAWGAEKKRLNKTYSNVHYIEDKFSHAKVHNSVLKANHVLILGGTFESYQIAQAVRTYLDDCGKFETKVTLLTTKDDNEVRKTLGSLFDKWADWQFKKERINFSPNCRIMNMVGDNDLEAVYFNREEDFANEKTPEVDYFLKPDVVIVENGIGRPRKELMKMVGYQNEGSEDKIHFSHSSLFPNSNIRFSLIHNNIESPIYAVGSCCEFPSFI